MKEGWTYKKLGEVGTFTRGGGFLKKDYVENGIPCIHYGQIHTVLGTVTKKHLTSIPESLRSKTRFATKGDIIFAITSEDVEGSCKCTAWLGDYDVAVGGHAAIYKHSLYPAFVSYFAKSPYFFKAKEKYVHGFKVMEIKPSDIAQIDIPVPSIEEQKRIVERLDAAFAHIDELKANAEKQLTEARALFQKCLTKAMEPKKGWEKKTIGELFKTYAGGTPIKTEKSYYEGGTIPWIRSGEICTKYITESEMFITEKGMKNSSAKYFPKNTVLVAMYGATAAQVGILKFEATSNQAVCGILPNDKYVSEFVYYWFTKIQRNLASQAQGGAQPNISQEKIKKVLIPTISISEQQRIVARLDSLSENVRKYEDIQRKVISECDALKQALLRKVFE